MEMVSVLEEDPGVGAQLSEASLPLAKAAAIAPLLKLRPGPHTFLLDGSMTHGHLGLLILGGLLAHQITFGEVTSTEFLGQGDVFKPWARARDPAESVQVQWKALTAIRLAVLDPDFARRVRPWPEIASALIDRIVQRADSHVLLLGICQARRVEDRVLLALWHFAGQWGTTGPGGRTIRLTGLTGKALAGVVGARRQSVSTALGRLVDRGAIVHQPDGTVALAGEPPGPRHVRFRQAEPHIGKEQRGVADCPSAEARSEAGGAPGEADERL
jgi:CRP/FNR family cyclic AMP-dependent transcriptional regulator